MNLCDLYGNRVTAMTGMRKCETFFVIHQPLPLMRLIYEMIQKIEAGYNAGKLRQVKLNANQRVTHGDVSSLPHKE